MRAAWRAQKLFGSRTGNKSVSVAFVSLAASKKLNHTYRGKNKPTNVLSFVSQDPRELGDIVIAPEKARLEAREQGIGINEHITYLFCHGLLHLLGFDHQSKKDELRMESAATELLNTK
ncbi:MAG: rRNA maturation RNase YbeY [Patescibacteria group bacterium]|nr:rRNA maturation RNase YbeY [Patescibacteria group bacterium]